MEQTTRKRSERAPAEQVEETPETESDREAKLAELDELLDEIDEVLEENEAEVKQATGASMRAHWVAHDDSPDAQCARVGLYGPSDLDEAVLDDLVAYADQLAEQEADELQAELEQYTNEQNPPCAFCGMCPVRPGCPFQANGETFYRAFDGTFVHD